MKRGITILAALTLGLPLGLAAKTAISDEVTAAADFRVRVEGDFDGHTAAGAPRDDRTRIRIRTRAGLVWRPDDTWSWGIRARTGSDSSHRSGHITILDFSGNDTGDADVNFDKWYLRADGDSGFVWVGRNTIPLWMQSAYPWKGDATVAGVGGGVWTEVGDGRLTFQGGWFSAPAGMREFSGQVGGAQLMWKGPVGETSLTLAGSVLLMDGDPGDPDGAMLATGNGARDYTVWTGSAQIKFDAGQTPLALGVDLIHNSEDYDPADPDPFTAMHAGHVDGHVFLVKVGSLSQEGDWMGGWWCADVEALAANSSFATDDWVRWGEPTDIEGHEFRIARQMSSNSNLTLRVFFVDSLSTMEDGSRARLDYNVKL